MEAVLESVPSTITWRSPVRFDRRAPSNPGAMCRITPASPRFMRSSASRKSAVSRTRRKWPEEKKRESRSREEAVRSRSTTAVGAFRTLVVTAYPKTRIWRSGGRMRMRNICGSRKSWWNSLTSMCRTRSSTARPPPYRSFLRNIRVAASTIPAPKTRSSAVSTASVPRPAPFR